MRTHRHRKDDTKLCRVAECDFLAAEGSLSLSLSLSLSVLILQWLGMGSCTEDRVVLHQLALLHFAAGSQLIHWGGPSGSK
jgi:hypothetical protein